MFIQELIDAEMSLQFQMGPVVEWVSQGVGDGARPGLKLLVGCCITGTEALRNTVGPHGTPLVVVPFEPNLLKVSKLPVSGNVAGRKMRMVVQNRFVGC